MAERQERRFEAELVNEFRMRWFDRMGEMPSAMTAQTALTLLADLRERAVGEASSEHIRLYDAHHNGYREACRDIAEALRTLPLLRPDLERG